METVVGVECLEPLPPLPLAGQATVANTQGRRSAQPLDHSPECQCGAGRRCRHGQRCDRQRELHERSSPSRCYYGHGC